MQNKSKTAEMSSTNFYLMVALVTALVVLATAYFGQTLIKKSILNSHILTAVNKANSQLDKNLEAATKLVANYEAASSAKTLIADALPDTGDYPGLIALMENASNSTGINLKSVSSQQTGSVGLSTSASNGAQPFTFALSISGTYTQITNFLGALQLSSRPIQISNLSLSGTTNAMTADIVGVAYYQSAAVLPFTTETVK